MTLPPKSAKFWRNISCRLCLSSCDGMACQRRLGFRLRHAGLQSIRAVATGAAGFVGTAIAFRAAATIDGAVAGLITGRACTVLAAGAVLVQGAEVVAFVRQVNLL